MSICTVGLSLQNTQSWDQQLYYEKPDLGLGRGQLEDNQGLSPPLAELPANSQHQIVSHVSKPS